MKLASLSSVCGFAGIFCAALLAQGCSHRSSSLPVYGPAQTGTPISVQKGTVVAVRDVLIQAPNAQAGTPGAGAQIGAGAVTSVITGNPGAIGAAVGRVVGGTLGARADDAMGEEITIELDGGERMIIVQERNGPPLAPGEVVEIHTAGGTTGRNRSVYGGNTKVLRAANPFTPGKTLAASSRSPAARPRF
jgi:outer membrane lipoprotein SlyB